MHVPFTTCLTSENDIEGMIEEGREDREEVVACDADAGAACDLGGRNDAMRMRNEIMDHLWNN